MANMNISISGGEAFETYLNTQIKVSERAIPVVKRNGAAMQHLAIWGIKHLTICQILKHRIPLCTLVNNLILQLSLNHP